MRVVVLFCIVFGSVATLRGESTEISSETDLARSYYSAVERNDQAGVEKALKSLQKHFPKDAITQLVIDHWKQNQNASESREWRQMKEKRQAGSGKIEAHPNLKEQFLVSYQIADLVAPVSPTEESRKMTLKNSQELADLVRGSSLNEQTGEDVVFHELNLSLVVRGSKESHAKCQRLFGQLRRQHDLQLTYEIRLASIEPEVANTFSLRESISPAVLQKRLNTISKSQNSSLIMAPKVTLFNDQLAAIETSSEAQTTKVELHGKSTSDRRSIRTEVSLSLSDQARLAEFRFSTSELIADGQTAVFFVKSEDCHNSFYDRRLLNEKGIEVASSDSNQLFLFVTPRIIITEEEEKLIGGNPIWPSYASYTNANAHYPSYPRSPTGSWAWTPPKLEWDDGVWGLDFAMPPNDQWKISPQRNGEPIPRGKN